MQFIFDLISNHSFNIFEFVAQEYLAYIHKQRSSVFELRRRDVIFYLDSQISDKLYDSHFHLFLINLQFLKLNFF